METLDYENFAHQVLLKFESNGPISGTNSAWLVNIATS
jgi:hypothetical protein